MDNVRMTAEEIRRNYNEAKDKPRQITILADMNLCSRAEIKKIINGEINELPPLKKKKSDHAYEHPSSEGRKGVAKTRLLSDEEKQTIIKMYLNGKSEMDITKEVGRSITAVKKAILDYRETRFKEEIEPMVFAEEMTPEQREQFTEQVEADAAMFRQKVTEGDLSSVAGGVLEAIWDLRAAGYKVFVEATADDMSVSVMLEKGRDHAFLKRGGPDDKS